VRQYGARCDGHTDDMAAIQKAEQAAAKAALPGRATVVQLPAGVCTIGGPIAWDSNVDLEGAGMSATTLRALASFTYDPQQVRIGPDGRQIGMIWLDGPTATTPIQNVVIENLGFDPRAGVQNWSQPLAIRLFYPINCYMRPVQNLTVQHVYFELGANPSAAYTTTGTAGPKAFVGVSLTHLGVDPLVPSHDLVFNDIHAHNGDGTLRFALVGTTKNGTTSKLYNVTVSNEYDNVDLDYIEDDRIEFDGFTYPYNAPLLNAPLGEIYNLTFTNINITVAPTVTIGSINGLRLNSSYNTEIHDVLIDGMQYTGSPAGYVPSTVKTMHDGTGGVTSMNGSDIQGYINNIVEQNITATNTIGVGVALGAPPGQPLSADMRNITVHNAFVFGGIQLSFLTPKPTVRRPNSAYDITLSGIEVDGSPMNALEPSVNPIGIEILDHLATSGDPAMQLQDVTATNFKTAILLDHGFDGALLENVHWNGAVEILSKVVEVDSGPL
jgi:hypothetical protein